MAYFCSSNDKRNFQWVTVATLDLIKLPLKDILASQIKPVDLFQKILSCSTLMLRTDQRKLCLIQPPGLPDYNTFDVTLLYTLIRNLCGLPSPAQGWGKEPKATDTQISDDIERLRLFRNNYYAHANSASISDDVFEDVWRNLKLAIKRFNSKTRCNTDYEDELIMIERSKFTDDHLKTCRILLDALANIEKQTDSKDEPDISIKGENEKNCGETALFEANVEKVKSSSWTITWHKRRGDVIKCIDTSMERYSGSTKRKLVIKSVCKEDEGEYQAVLSLESNGPYYRSKNIIRLFVYGEVPSVKILVDSPVCFGSTTTIKSEVSSTPKPKKIEWQKSKDRIDFYCTEKPIYLRSTDIFTSPSYVIPKTTFTDKLYYRVLVWNEIGKGVSNTVYLDVTGSPPNIMTSFETNIKDRLVKLIGSMYFYDDSPGILETFWTKNEKKIDPEKSGGKLSEISNDTPSLTIRNVSPDDAGEYRLTATNAVGSSTSDVIVLGIPSIFLEKIEDKKNGGQRITVMIKSLPAPFHVQWSAKSKDDGNFTPIDRNTEEYEGTTVSFPHPVLVVRHRDQIEKNCFKIEVTNFIGNTVQEISGENNPVVLSSTDNAEETPYNDHGASVRFTRLNNILADQFPPEKVEKLKFLLETSKKVKNQKSVLKAKSAMDCLRILQDEHLFTQKDVIFMQFLCRETDCLKLYAKCIEYAEKQKALCFFEKQSVNGYVDVQFHVQGDLSDYSKEFIQKVIETVAAILDCTEEDIQLNALRYSTSFFLSLSIKKVYIRKLLALKEQDRLNLKKLNIDYLKIDEETIHLNRGEDYIEKRKTMDICNIATTVRANMLFLWSFINQQPKEMFLGSIVGWFIGWNLFYLGKVPSSFMYIVVMVIATVFSMPLIFLMWVFEWIPIKDILINLVTCLFCVCAFHMSVLLVFGEADVIILLVTGAVSLVSLVMAYGFDNTRLVISKKKLNKLWNILVYLIVTFCLSGCVVWVSPSQLMLPLTEDIFFVYFGSKAAVLMMSLVMVYGFNNLRLGISKGILNKLWNCLVSLIVTFCYCGYVVWVSPFLLVHPHTEDIFFVYLESMAAVLMMSLVMVFSFNNMRLVISKGILNKLWNFLVSLIVTFCLSGCVVWVSPSQLMPPLTEDIFFVYFGSMAAVLMSVTIMTIMKRVGPRAFSSVRYRRKQNVNSQIASTHGQASQVLTLGTKRHVPQSFEGHAIQSMSIMNIVEPSSGEEIDLDGLSSTSSELLPPKGTVLYSRKQDVNSQFVSTHDQASQEITLGTGHVQIPPSQKTGHTNVPPSEHNSEHIQDDNSSEGQQRQTAPSTFKLVSVITEQEQPPPPEAKPGHLKPSLDQIDHQILQSLDDHAVEVSKSEHPSFRELVWDLIFSKPISNELEKVRAIFRWLASKNFKEIIFNNVEKGSPEEVLLGLKESKTTYVKVFDTMCNYAGIHSRIINGYAKGINYKPGMKFNPGTNQHSWNAVYINETWGLVDADWAARGLIKKLKQLHYQLDDYYFLPDPHHFICDHFPDDNQWQLLERPMTLEEFENMPHIKPRFFKYGLEFVSDRTAMIYGQDEMNVCLSYPANKVAVDFYFGLGFDSGEEEYKETKLNRFGMVESIAGIASFRLRLPTKGSYILSIYVKEYISENNVNLNNVCEYKIVQEEVSVTDPPPFPPCTYLNWGPNTYFYRYGLATNQQTAQISTKDGKAELQIIIPQQMQFMTKLKHNDRNDADLEGYVTHRIVENNVYFNITAPSRGEYGLEIHANDPATEGSTMYHVAQYLVDCNEDVKTVSLPKLSAGYLGAKPKFNDYGMNTLSHQNPVIDLEANTVEIQFSVAQEVRVGADLIEVETNRKMPEFVFIQTKDSVISLIVNCPSAGFYKLQLYALPVHDPNQQLQGVYNYLINCQTKTENVYPFPIQYTKWTKGCYMWEPLVIHKEIGKPTVNFHVKIPKAENVAVEINEKWTYLQSSQPEIWQGEVNLAPYYGEGVKVTVNANFGGDKTNYSTLLEYSV